jgi:hypothetical protein
MVAENIIRQATKGFEEPINARFDMLEAGQYKKDAVMESLQALLASCCRLRS